MLVYLVDEESKLFKKRMAEIVSDRQKKLSRESKELEKASQQSVDEKVNEIKN